MKTDNGPLLSALIGRPHWALPAVVRAGSNTAAILDTEVPMLKHLKYQPPKWACGAYAQNPATQAKTGWPLTDNEQGSCTAQSLEDPGPPWNNRTLERDSLLSYADQKALVKYN